MSPQENPQVVLKNLKNLKIWSLVSILCKFKISKNQISNNCISVKKKLAKNAW